jgi:hypothetical protein
MNYTDDPSWYKKVKKNDTWLKRVLNKSYYDSVKIISVVNQKNKKYVKVEFPTGKRSKVEPGWLFYNYAKEN